LIQLSVSEGVLKALAEFKAYAAGTLLVLDLIGTFVFGASLIAFSLTTNVWLAAVILAFGSAGFMTQMASTNTIIQTIVDERFRGRVMAFYTMAFFGTAPLGSLLAGLAADRVGARWTIAAGGVISLAAGCWLVSRLPALRAIVRPIYIERGILPVPAVDSGTKTL